MFSRKQRTRPSMRRLLTAALWIGLFAGALQLPAGEAPDDGGSAPIALDDNHVLIAPVHYKNLTVWQVSAKKVPDLANVVALQQAQADNQVEIRETGEGGEVNKLVIENKGKQTVLVLAGTIVKGGKQDRQIGQDFLVPPGQTVNVDSFCVEHGRWTTQRQMAAAQTAVQPNSAGGGGGGGGNAVATAAVQERRMEETITAAPATDANPAPPEAQTARPALVVQTATEQPERSVDTGGKFEAQASMANSAVRTQGQYAADQQQVWNEVAKTNLATGAATATGTLMATKEAIQENPDRKAIVALLQEKLRAAADRQVVGLAYAVNGKIVNLRWFLAPQLYEGFRQSLIETIADDTLALNAELGAESITAYEKSPKTCGAAEFKQFMQADRTEKRKRDAAANCNTYYESAQAYSSEAVGKEGDLKDQPLSVDYTAK